MAEDLRFYDSHSANERVVSLNVLDRESIEAISRTYGLSAEEGKARIGKGISSLSSYYVSFGERFTLPFLAPLDDYPVPEITDALAIDVKNRGCDALALYLNPHAAAELSNKNGESSVISVGLDNLKPTVASLVEFDDEGKEPVIAIIQNDVYLHEKSLFSYGFYKSDGELYGIIPFTLSVSDERIEELEGGVNVYFRNAQTETVQANLASEMENVKDVIKEVKDKLEFVRKRDLNLNFILDGGEDMVAFQANYEDEKGDAVYVVDISKRRLEMARKEEDKKLIIRHEFLHALDKMLGGGVKTFSELNGGKLLDILSRNLFSGEEILLGDNGEGIDWGDKADRIRDLFTESCVFESDGFMPGHATSNIKEFFVSNLNIYLDQRFSSRLNSLPNEERDSLDRFYKELINYLSQQASE